MSRSVAHTFESIAARDLLGPSRSLRAVEVFAAGVHRGEDWTLEQLQQAVNNFHKFRDGNSTIKIEPVAVLGHSEEQALSEDAGLPNVGTVSDLRLSGSKLVADFDNVPEIVARLIEAGRYNTVSAEFWPDLVEGDEHLGTTLRRVAFLGSEMPQVKSLNPQGLAATVAKHGDTFRPRSVSIRGKSRRETSFGTICSFSEVSPMNRDQMMAMLPPGLNPEGEFVKGLSDEQLGALVSEYHAAEESAEGPHTAESGGIPVPPVLNADPVPDNSTPEPPAKPEEPMKYADQLKALEAKLASVQKFADERLKHEKAARIDAVVSNLIQSGKLLPANAEVTRFALDKADTATVSKFSDGSTGTEFDRLVKQLEASPKVVEFGDKLKQRGTEPVIDNGLKTSMLSATPLGRAILRDSVKN